jgi:hypothetical protein
MTTFIGTNENRGGHNPAKVSAKAFLATRWRRTLLAIMEGGEVPVQLAERMAATLADHRPTREASSLERFQFSSSVVGEAVTLAQKATRHNRLVVLLAQYVLHVQMRGREEAQWIFQRDAEHEGFVQEDLDALTDTETMELGEVPALWTRAEMLKGGA